jgi:hypothetical protein
MRLEVCCTPTYLDKELDNDNSVLKDGHCLCESRKVRYICRICLHLSWKGEIQEPDATGLIVLPAVAPRARRSETAMRLCSRPTCTMLP